MEPRIAILPEKKLVGRHLTMSLASNRTFELWRSFMPLGNLIQNKLSDDLFSMQVYPNSIYFEDYDPAMEYEKWAAIEVADFQSIPGQLQGYTINGGLYAVFNYIGPANEGYKIFQYIFTEWLPASDYELDAREHFEVLGAKYKNNEPDSEEEIWIPIKRKA